MQFPDCYGAIYEKRQNFIAANRRFRTSDGPFYRNMKIEMKPVLILSFQFQYYDRMLDVTNGHNLTPFLLNHSISNTNNHLRQHRFRNCVREFEIHFFTHACANFPFQGITIKPLVSLCRIKRKEEKMHSVASEFNSHVSKYYAKSFSFLLPLT